MKGLIFLLFLTVQLYAAPFDKVSPSSPEEIASLSPNLVIEKYVSALSGQLSISEIDLQIKGAQDLIFKRIYIPPQILGRYHKKDKADRLALGKALEQLNSRGWITLPQLWAGYNCNSPYFQVRDPQGLVLEFEIQGNRGLLKTSTYGCCNLQSDEVSGKFDIRNIELSVKESQVEVLWPDGTKRIYIYKFPGLFRLDRELLPNGKAIRYQWDYSGLKRIVTTDPSGKYTYASLTRIGHQHYLGSDGREVKLIYEQREIKGKIKTKKYTEKVKFNFPLMTRASNPTYSNNAGYNERTLLSSYDAQAYPISCNYYEQKGVLSRIKTFTTPSGSISFSYDSPIAGRKTGSTVIKYPDGAEVVYRFNSFLLLSAIENWYEGELYNQKDFIYDDKQHISKIEIKDKKGTTLLTKLYECDKNGNPILETQHGDCGFFSIRRTFSKNRLISEIRDDGLSLEYSYLGETNLLLSKSIFMDGKLTRKTSYTYDEANNLIQEKEEGKTITTYLLYQEGPHLHRVHFKEEKDWNNQLIHITEYAYDCFGNTAQENHYGSDGSFAYSLDRVYDAKGNLLQKTNPLGQEATYSYDQSDLPPKFVHL
jgi:hypothetical protein